jgi:predicted transposase/invertase (TIGR01784 family)
MFHKSTIHNPHDKALFHSLKHHKVASDMMKAYLPKSLLAQADLTKIALYKSKLLSPEYKEFQADIVYEVPFKTTKGLFLFHCEQQSQIEKGMPLRMWQYALGLLKEYQENHPHQSLPIIYPLVIYTGENESKLSMDIFDLFGENKAEARHYLLKPVDIIDVCRLSDDDIRKRELFGLTEFAFKHKKNPAFEQVLDTLLPWLERVSLKLSVDYARMLLKYVVDVYPDANYEIFSDKIKAYMSEQLRGETMTIAEQLRQKGIEQGIEQGIERGIEQGIEQGMQTGMTEGMRKKEIEVARNLIALGLSEEVILKGVSISREELKKLKAEVAAAA